MTQKYATCPVCGNNMYEPFRGKDGKIIWNDKLTKEHILPTDFVRMVNESTAIVGFPHVFTSNDPRNLTYTCRICNRLKSNKVRYPYKFGSAQWVLSTLEDRQIINRYAEYLIENSSRITWFYKYGIVYNFYGLPKQKDGYKRWFEFLELWSSGVREFQ